MNKEERTNYQVLETECYNRDCFVPLKLKVIKICKLYYEDTCPETGPILSPKKLIVSLLVMALLIPSLLFANIEGQTWRFSFEGVGYEDYYFKQGLVYLIGSDGSPTLIRKGADCQYFYTSNFYYEHSVGVGITRYIYGFFGQETGKALMVFKADIGIVFIYEWDLTLLED